MNGDDLKNWSGSDSNVTRGGASPVARASHRASRLEGLEFNRLREKCTLKYDEIHDPHERPHAAAIGALAQKGLLRLKTPLQRIVKNLQSRERNPNPWTLKFENPSHIRPSPRSFNPPERTAAVQAPTATQAVRFSGQS
jgi:hypothetical protein